MLFGRESKLESLEKNWASSGTRFVVIYGGRRMGKTKFLGEFSKGKKGVFFSAQRLNSFANLRLFEKAVESYSETEEHFDRWRDAFLRIADFAKEERFLLAIDDFADLVFEDESILKDFRAAFENEWRNTQLFVAASCGRVFFTESEIIAENSAAAVRRPLIYKLDELDYFDAAKALPKGISARDKLRYYCCLGGVPEYLLMVKENESFEQNIRRLFLEENSPLGFALQEIYTYELREPEFYSSILAALSGGCKRINEIVAATGESSTKVNKYLLTLLQMQIVNRDVPFGEEGRTSRKGVYSVAPKALAFWYRFVMPNRAAIARGEAAVENITAAVDEYISGKLYEQVCTQYMQRKNKQGMLPFLGSVISGYWGSLKECGDAQIVAANQRNRQILFAKCAERFVQGTAEQTIAALRQNDRLFTEYWERYDMLFSLEPFPRDFRNAENMKLKLVDAEALYK